MVTSNHSWEEQTSRLLSEAQTDLNKIDAQIKELKEKRDEINAEIQAFKIALGAYLNRTGRQKDIQVDWVGILKPMSLKDKLVAIAKAKGGLLKHSQATDIIFTNKLTSAKKRATVYQMVKNALDLLLENGTLVKTGPGEYKLVESQPKLLE